MILKLLFRLQRIKILDEDGCDQKKSVKDVKSNKDSENMQKVQVMQEKQKENVPKTKITAEAKKKDIETSHKNSLGSNQQTVSQRKADFTDHALKNYKIKLQEEKKKKQEYKEHFKQMIEGVDDVFLLPHHNKKNQEFIIEESKDQKRN